MIGELNRRAEALRVGLQELLQDSIVRDIVQGATMEVDPYWFVTILCKRSRTRHENTQLPIDPWEEWYRTYHCDRLMWQTYWDFSEKPLDWKDYCRAKSYPEDAQPLLIRIILRKPIAPDNSSLGDSRYGTLPRAFEEYPLVYEVRPPVIASGWHQALSEFLGLRDHAIQKPLAYSVGRADPRTSGTAGGYLYCSATDTRYLVSCAHVLGSIGTSVYTPGPHENKGSSPLGIVRFAEIPKLKRAGERCNLQAMPGAGRLDVAVAEVMQSTEATTDVAAASSTYEVQRCEEMSSYQRVQFVGKESGLVHAQVSAVTLWHEIDFMDFGEGVAGTRCFGTLFELSDRVGDKHELAQPGDSGAWIFDSGCEAHTWNGILIARQGKRAYGCYAEHIMTALNQHTEFPGGLTVIGS